MFFFSNQGNLKDSFFDVTTTFEKFKFIAIFFPDMIFYFIDNLIFNAFIGR